MFAIIYGIIKEDEELTIDGPFYHKCDPDFDRSEILAKELAKSKTKHQIIPWVIELNEGETIPEAMIRVEDGWYKKFKKRTLQTYSTIQKDQFNSSCPFCDVDVDDFKKIYLKKQEG